MFWAHATCLSALLCELAGFVACPTIGHSRFWDGGSEVEISRRRWLCRHPGLLSRHQQCSWLRPDSAHWVPVLCQQEGLAAQGGSRDLAGIPQAVRALLSL